jgi:hypothetical protein
MHLVDGRRLHERPRSAGVVVRGALDRWLLPLLVVHYRDGPLTERSLDPDDAVA